MIGSGGREHTLAWKLKESPLCNELYIAPGNAGTAGIGENLPIAITDFDSITAACLKYSIGMLIVGPEEPLVNGITDHIKSNRATSHIYVIGPSKHAALLEGSKAFAKSFMNRYNIPTASYKEFTADNYKEGITYIKEHSLPVVLKADGLAAGKGVLICQSHIEALAEFELMILRSKFGEAGSRVVIEEFLEGIEVSVFVLTDGTNYVMLPEAKDYKRIGEGDKGLNTGGMGAVSPLPFFDKTLVSKIVAEVIEPSIDGLRKENMDYRGFLFFGLMINKGEPFVIEYNCRMGDPETEAVIPRLKNDLVELLLATAKQQLKGVVIKTDRRTAVTVVAVSGGYPGHYEKGRVVEGLDVKPLPGSLVFQAGTKIENGEIVTNGGRILAITSFGDNITEASEQSNYMLQQLYFEDMYYRTDIGYEFKVSNVEE